MGAEGALFRFGVKSRKLGRRRRPVLHSEEARGAAGALRKYLGALAPKMTSEELLTWSESSAFLIPLGRTSPDRASPQAHYLCERKNRREAAKKTFFEEKSPRSGEIRGTEEIFLKKSQRGNFLSPEKKKTIF